MSVLYLVFFLLRQVLYIVCEFRNTYMYAFLTLCLLGNFACFFVICFFSKKFFQCQTVWIQIGSKLLEGKELNCCNIAETFL